MSGGWAVAIACVAAFTAGAGLTRLVLRLSGTSLVALPNERTTHRTPTPTGGGLGFLGAFALCLGGLAAWTGDPALIRLLPALAAVLPLAAIGYLDDRRGAARWTRSVVHVGVAAVLVGAYARLPLPFLPDGDGGTLLSFGLCTLAAAATINFYNFMDGMDGLVAGCTAVQMVFWGAWQGQPGWWLLAAALAGFLVWNWSPARIFMGDVGSTVLGAFVVIALLDATPSGAWSAQYLVVALPLVGDALYTLARRLVRGEDVLRAHHSHIYQRLIRAHGAQRRIAGLYVGLAVAMALVSTLPGALGLLVAAGLFAAFVAAAEWWISRRNVPFAVGRI